MFSLNQKPCDFQVLFLDMDSFFASIEQQVQPPLRGQAIGIAPYTGATGCVIAASKEAKTVGVKTGMGVGEAKRIYPKIKIVEARPALYMIYHQEIKKALENITPFYQPLSVDEFILPLSPSEQNFQKATEIGRKIKTNLKSQVGDFLTCSVGIGPNRFLAKMISEENKPDGLAVVELAKLNNFYVEFSKLTDLTGINCQLAKRLNFFQIKTPEQFFQKSSHQLEKILKHWGKLWYLRLRGFEVDDYASQTQNIGHSHVLAPEFRNRTSAEAVIKKLIFKSSSRLRQKGFSASGVSVAVRFTNRTSFAKSRRVPTFSYNLSFTKNIFSLLADCLWHGQPIWVSVSAFWLKPDLKNHQIAIFPQMEKIKKSAEALDKLNDKFGAETIYPAAMHQVLKTAPDRIAFGKPRYEIRH